jgi:hypothetical protein
MVKVLITIDTEVHPARGQWRQDGLREEIAQYLDGFTPRGSFGLDHQLSVLARHGLRGVFFVEALAATELGTPFLTATVSKIRTAGQEVQLHLHTEWLQYLSRPLLDGRRGDNIRDFTEEEQGTLLGEGLRNLKTAGAPEACAFRAGNYGADSRTLRAMLKAGLRYDSSWNKAYLGRPCGIDAPEALLGPTRLEGVWEIPIAFFEDYPGHHRHAQLAACTFEEMRGALEQAHERGFPTFVIVSHSFELVWRGVARGRPASPRTVVIRRFEQLCAFLSANRDRFETTGFADLGASDHRPPRDPRPLRSSVLKTVHRYAEQAAGRLW